MKGNTFHLEVFGHWDPDQGFLLWGGGGTGLRWDLNEIRFNLFSGHQASYYGSFLGETGYQGHQALILSPLTALDFFSRPFHSGLFSVSWSMEIKSMQKAAVWIRDMLRQGKYMPDFDQWREGKDGWKLISPPNQKLIDSLPYLGDWINGIFSELIAENAGIRQAWQSLTDSSPLLRPDLSRTGVFLDEDDWLETIGWKKDHTPFVTCLQLVEPGENPAWTLNILLQDKEDPQRIFDFKRDDLSFDSSCPASWQPHLTRPLKEIRKWVGLLPRLSDPSRENGLIRQLTDEEAWDFLTVSSVQLVEAGAAVFLPAWWDAVRLQKSKIKARTRSSVGTASKSFLGVEQLIQFDWQLAVGDLELSPEEFKKLAAEKKHLVHFKDHWIRLDPMMLETFKKVVKENKKGMTLGEVLQKRLLAADEPEDDEMLPVELEIHEDLQGMISRLSQMSSLVVAETPPSFQGTLRPYQSVGFSWLLFLRRFGLGGCLADDMGLGKTIQMIAYLLEVKDNEPYAGPSLLICPTSVIGNWQMELKRFAPELKIHLHYGPQRSKGEAFQGDIGDCDLVITSFALAYIDEKDLADIQWTALCLDEAQNIKNAYTKQAMAIKKLKGSHRIALTGTPMENRLTELWSIMDFLNPGYLGGLTSFNRRFGNIIEKTGDAVAVDRVKRLVRPFLLRRLKSDPAVELDLPEKQEFKEYLSLTPEQAALYENVIDDMFQRLTTADGMEKRGVILASLTKLKQICNHPGLYLKEKRVSRAESRSAKVTRLMEMVSELRENGDRCLIFTQFVEMGNMLQEMLRRNLKEPVLFLHGGTPKAQRDAMVALFQSQDQPAERACGVFILSLKAGGSGLNLTAANHVFHFDRWWNPAVENQATDRTHRIGQHRHVQVYKFIALGTLEERIDAMIEEKQGLNEMIVGGESWITELSTAELKEAFTLRKEWVGVS